MIPLVQRSCRSNVASVRFHGSCARSVESREADRTTELLRYRESRTERRSPTRSRVGHEVLWHHLVDALRGFQVVFMGAIRLSMGQIPCRSSPATTITQLTATIRAIAQLRTAETCGHTPQVPVPVCVATLHPPIQQSHAPKSVVSDGLPIQSDEPSDRPLRRWYPCIHTRLPHARSSHGDSSSERPLTVPPDRHRFELDPSTTVWILYPVSWPKPDWKAPS